ncbi:MAG: hypothetical protein JNM43_28755 [Planctomycetaceae bacterium]|nr:hypothetical protein [Planctomycetaceae bacterium]
MADSCLKSFVKTHILPLALTAGCMVCLSVRAGAQDPTVDRVETSQLRPGQRATVTVHGKQLNGALGFWTPAGVLRPKEGTDLTKDQPVTLEGDIKADATPGIYPARFVSNHGASEATWVVVDDLPTTAITGDADNRATGQALTLPCCLFGQINPVVSKTFRFTMTTGQVLSAEVFARRIGSDLDPVLRLFGPDGKELLYRDDMPGGEGDTQLQWTAAADGEYRLELRDVRYSGGGRHYFHLRLGKLSLVTTASPRIARVGQNVSLIGTTGDLVGETPMPGTADVSGALIPVSFRAADAEASGFASVVATSNPVQSETEPNDAKDQATVIAPDTAVLAGTFQKAGDVDWFRITATEATPLLIIARTREVASPCDVVLELYNADGGKIAESDDAGPRDAEVTAQLPGAGEFYLKVSEIAGRGGAAWTWALDVFRARKSVRAVAPADRLNVPRGGNAALPLTLRRIQYDGPLKVEAVSLPAALKMNPFVVGSKQSTVPIVLTAADPAATSSDADWGPITLKISTPDGSLPPAELQLVPPPPKKADNEVFRSARVRSDVFAAVAPASQFSFTVEPATVTLPQGGMASVTIKATRAADWTMPIEIAYSTPADQVSPGLTVAGGSMPAGEFVVNITAAADAAVGPCTIFLQGKAKKDNTEVVQPVPPIQVEVTAK